MSDAAQFSSAMYTYVGNANMIVGDVNKLDIILNNITYHVYSIVS